MHREGILEGKQNLKIILQYEGTRYDGWQKQGNTEHTIQGKLEAILSRMAGETVEVHGSGRTDAGVHAMGQVANFHIPAGFSPEQVSQYLNRYLPEDIAVLDVCRVADRFHSRLSAVGKTYCYRIETGCRRDVFARRTQYGLGEPLDVAAMRRAAGFLCGTHDFRSFCGNRNMKKSTVRTVESIEICQDDGSTLLLLSFTGDGFLQSMVRIMVGTLIEAGQGKRSPESMEQVLAARDRQAAGFTAPPEGLCLMEVFY